MAVSLEHLRAVGTVLRAFAQAFPGRTAHAIVASEDVHLALLLGLGLHLTPEQIADNHAKVTAEFAAAQNEG